MVLAALAARWHAGKLMNKTSPFLLVICYLGFVSLGLPDTLLGVAWPFIRGSFALPQAAAAAAFIAMGMAYALSGSASGRLLGSLGTGRLLVLSSAAVTLAVFGFAGTPAWWLFVLAAMVHGFGSGAIDTGLNDFVSRRFSARHMNWLHACYSLGAAAGPAVMTAAVSPHGAWRTGYLAVGGILLILTLLFVFTRHGWADGGPISPVPALRAPLRAGAQDERFDVVISNNSGCGGAALSKRCFGETVGRINTSFPHWFAGNFKQWNGREAEMPYDQHELLALVAPRGLLVCSAEEDQWADPEGELQATKQASPAFVLLGQTGLEAGFKRENLAVSPGNPGYWQRPGKHDVTVDDWKRWTGFVKARWGK